MMWSSTTTLIVSSESTSPPEEVAPTPRAARFKEMAIAALRDWYPTEGEDYWDDDYEELYDPFDYIHPEPTVPFNPVLGQ
jgi:hypothetical protein